MKMSRRKTSKTHSHCSARLFLHTTSGRYRAIARDLDQEAVQETMWSTAGGRLLYLGKSAVLQFSNAVLYLMGGSSAYWLSDNS